ncbi:MAG: trigger factor [Lachnospiraceae bacterium]|nr:trigger factor [Lachnospiraceae bacterium]
MKKSILAIIMTVMLAVMMAGCGNSSTNEQETPDQGEAGRQQDADEPEEGADGQEDKEEASDEPAYISDFQAKDYVTLGQYKGVEVNLVEPEVTQESVDEYMEYVLSSHAQSSPVTGRGAQSGDIVNVDFEGKLDGVAFAGGSANGFDLTIGAGGFIDGFEDAIIGMEIGETKDADLKFPDPYDNNPDLAGKDVVFTFTLNSISERIMPELTDEFVENLGIDGCTTVEEYTKFIHDGLMEQAMAAFEEEKISAAIAAVEANVIFETAPEGMTKRMKETLTDTVSSYAQMYGMSVEDYVAAAYGGAADSYEEVLLEQAGMMAQRYLMIGAIAEAEGITVTDEEMDQILTEEAANFGYENVEEYKEELDVEAYREYLLVQKVIEFLAENAVVKAPVSE